MVQNFRGLRAVLLTAAAEDGEATRMLAPALGRLGVTLQRQEVAAPLAAAAPQPCELLVLDGDDDLATLLAPLPPDWLARLPIIGLVGVEAPGRLRALLQAGATAFLRKPVHGSAVYAALVLGVNAQRARQHGAALLAEQERRRRGRRMLIRATLRLMQQHALDDDAAYDLLRRAAMRARMSIEDYSEAWMAGQPAEAPTPHTLTTQRIA